MAESRSSSQSQMFCGIATLKQCTKFTGKQLPNGPSYVNCAEIVPFHKFPHQESSWNHGI